MQIDLETFINVANVAFTYFDEKSPYFYGDFKMNEKSLQQTIFNKIVKLLNMKIDFEKEIAIFSGSEEDFEATLEDIHKHAKPFKVTYVKLDCFDIDVIEELFYKNEDIASYFYPLFASIGYSLVNMEGRWRLTDSVKKYGMDYNAMVEYYGMLTELNEYE